MLCYDEHQRDYQMLLISVFMSADAKTRKLLTYPSQITFWESLIYLNFTAHLQGQKES